MMKEIFKNGPIVVALNAAPDHYYYSSGVFITNPLNRMCKIFIIKNNPVRFISKLIKCFINFLFTNLCIQFPY